jgi:WD40 repeat protein/class 3 adenylate cyclase/tRNA A-37 threonylcarbamoyl transferase component Bud32
MARLIRDRYELLDTLGVGGEARVVKALDRQHRRFVALKIRHVQNGASREALLNEARVLLGVPLHPALPLVREDFFDGEDYIVAMDWVDGIDLARLLRDRGRPGLAPSSVLAYLSDAAEALAHLHAQDPPIIHGDVKPANLILTKGGRVKLVDFGLSSAPGALQRRTGTPGFRAPELASGGPPSRAGDVFALAATAFALLTGSAPAGVLPMWMGIDPGQAEQLEAGIRLGLATDPARRPATPGELVERLRAGWAEALPAGVVTFCVSEIEGSTEMWDSDPVAMAEALVRHDELIADCVGHSGGRLLQSMGEGSSTVSVFDSATGAVEAALAATRALADEAWPADLRVAVRFALHTGEAERRGIVYYGPSMNLVARLRDQAEGGQVLLSAVTADLVRGHLADGYELIDLGPHRLSGIGAPERIHALKGPGVRTPAAATECPYRGLLAFGPEDRDYFFGREQVVAELIARLEPGKLLALVGPSGSGKSSVLRAGVTAAALDGELPGIHDVRELTPGSDAQIDPPTGADQLVVVDQFEELFTLGADPGHRQAFVDDLLAAPGPVAIGLRADMYGQLAAYPDLARAVAGNQLLLGAMSEAELERAVREPARLAGLRLEPGLVELAVREVAGEPGALPLLSHALRATWGRRDGRTLTVERYRDSGGVSAAIAQTADDVVGSLMAEQRELARSVFVRLTELREDVAETSRRVAIDELVPAGVARETVQEVLERLADARLVTLDDGTAEIAHEALIREWPTLRGWLDEDREGLRLHRRLGDAARLWDGGGREPADLYRGPRLSAAIEWAAGHVDQLNATERAFLDASSAAAEREQRAQLRSNRRLRALLAGTAMLLVVAAVAGVVAVIQRDHARAQALTSDAERIGAQALTDPNVDHSLLLAVTGVKLQNRLETRSDLFADLQQNAALIRLIRPSNVEITALDVSPDGRLLVVGDASGAVRFIDLANWRQEGPVVRLGAPIGQLDLTFSPDGATVMAVAISTHSSELNAIDVASRRVRRVLSWSGLPPQELEDGGFGVESVAYSPDGKRVAVTDETQPGSNEVPTASRLLMVDAATGRIIWQRRYPLRPGQIDPYVVFTRPGALLTTAPQGDTLLWDSATGRIVRRFPLGGLPALARDGRTLALGENSPTSGQAGPSSEIVLLDLRTGRRRTLIGTLPDSWVESLAFTPDGSEIAGAAGDGMHVWDVKSGKIIASYIAEAGPGALSTIDEKTDTLISTHRDGSITAFDLSGTHRLGRTFSWSRSLRTCPVIPCETFSPQSSLMALPQFDGTVAIVDLRTLRLARTLRAIDGSLTSTVSFMRDGRTLVTGGINRTVTFRDVDTGRVTRTLRFAEPVWNIGPSPDGRLLAVQTGPGDFSSNRVEVVQLSTGTVRQSYALPSGPGGVEFTRDGRELVALGCCGNGPGSTLVGWDASTGRQLFRLSAGLDAAAFDLTRDSRQLGVGTGGGQLLLLDARTGRPTAAPIQVATGPVVQISFSPDGHSVVASSTDHTVRVWDLRARARLGDAFGPYSGIIPDALFEPNGRLLIMLTSSYSAIQWPMNVDTWEQFACRVAGRNLTRAEWHDVLPNRTYQRVCPG